MKNQTLLTNSWFILLSSIGGYLLSLTGMAIGWMIGTLIVAGFVSFWKPSWIVGQTQSSIRPYWRHIGQAILGIELGQQISLSVVHHFERNWMLITLMLLLTIIFALLAGYLLWRYTNADMLTSLLGTTPGGISAMPSIAEEVGANTMTVSIVQMIRIFLVVGTVPLIASYSQSGGTGVIETTAVQGEMAYIANGFSLTSFLWTALLVIGSFGGYRIGKLLKLPAPWLVGGMLGVGVVHMIGSSYLGENLTGWWPHWLIILAQILIGASIGSRLHKDMFVGARQIVIVGLLTSIGLVAVMTLCAFGVSEATGIPFVTSVLAFAPGGVAEMATASVAFHANPAFVVAVQTLRLVTIFLVLPPFFRLLNRQTNHVVTKSS
ncbi:AbrB family transcriptional regulator [Bacillus sp. NTK071]|uniref:AbrB family transcriptional regulator n=1 Tax=Bacillus sp. NTK071 TaxID=2802175 RepID=UPI001A8CE86A|nr:AbrB family transcriptional regulator [Bacillus sp. NTK071]MBN8209039.1 AbrB family transcriptional regulator [Bacillus sp. NTK071]